MEQQYDIIYTFKNYKNMENYKICLVLTRPDTIIFLDINDQSIEIGKFYSITDLSKLKLNGQLLYGLKQSAKTCNLYNKPDHVQNLNIQEVYSYLMNFKSDPSRDFSFSQLPFLGRFVYYPPEDPNENIKKTSNGNNMYKLNLIDDLNSQTVTYFNQNPPPKEGVMLCNINEKEYNEKIYYSIRGFPYLIIPDINLKPVKIQELNIGQILKQATNLPFVGEFKAKILEDSFIKEKINEKDGKFIFQLKDKILGTIIIAESQNENPGNLLTIQKTLQDEIIILE